VGVGTSYEVRREEVIKKTAEHAKKHGIREVTPELIERVKSNIRGAYLKFLFGALTRGAAPGPFFEIQKIPI
jgi:predicted small metal-binding protein